MFRALFRKVLSTELGVVGDELKQLRLEHDALADTVSALADRFSRAQKGRREWATPLVPPEAAARLEAFLKGQGGNGAGNPDFM